MVLVLAFTGDNETRKNYFKALLAWVLLLVVAVVALGLVLAHSPTMLQQVKDWQAKQH